MSERVREREKKTRPFPRALPVLKFTRTSRWPAAPVPVISIVYSPKILAFPPFSLNFLVEFLGKSPNLFVPIGIFFFPPLCTAIKSLAKSVLRSHESCLLRSLDSPRFIINSILIVHSKESQLSSCLKINELPRTESREVYDLIKTVKQRQTASLLDCN